MLQAVGITKNEKHLGSKLKTSRSFELQPKNSHSYTKRGILRVNFLKGKETVFCHLLNERACNERTAQLSQLLTAIIDDLKWGTIIKLIKCY